MEGGGGVRNKSPPVLADKWKKTGGGGSILWRNALAPPLGMSIFFYNAMRNEHSNGEIESYLAYNWKMLLYTVQKNVWSGSLPWNNPKVLQIYRQFYWTEIPLCPQYFDKLPSAVAEQTHYQSDIHFESPVGMVGCKASSSFPETVCFCELDVIRANVT